MVMQLLPLFNMAKEKAQTSVEFMILMGFVLFSLIAFLMVIQSNLLEKNVERKTRAIEEIALIVQDEINLAHESSEGYFREFELPSDVDRMDYEINITAGFVYVRTTNIDYAISIPVQNVTGDVNAGDNSIRKVNGEVILNG